LFRLRIDEDASLIIQRARKEDHGRYQCSAKNLVATRDSRPVRLKVFGKQIFIAGIQTNKNHTLNVQIQFIEIQLCILQNT